MPLSIVSMTAVLIGLLPYRGRVMSSAKIIWTKIDEAPALAGTKKHLAGVGLLVLVGLALCWWTRHTD